MGKELEIPEPHREMLRQIAAVGEAEKGNDDASSVFAPGSGNLTEQKALEYAIATLYGIAVLRCLKLVYAPPGDGEPGDSRA